MGSRTELGQIFRDILGSSNVYFQPPETVKMKYDAIVYERTGDEAFHADNLPYHRQKEYTVTFISNNPDSPIPDKLAELPLCRYDRHYTSDNLHHDVFRIFY